MLYILFFVICFLASVAGAICGIGGGVIIKPLLDAFGIFDVSVISFLSGGTVLSMTACSVVRNRLSNESHVEGKTALPLAAGAAFGGLIGKWIFSYVKSLSADTNRVGAIQAICLLFVTAGTLLCTICRRTD